MPLLWLSLFTHKADLRAVETCENEKVVSTKNDHKLQTGQRWRQQRWKMCRLRERKVITYQYTWFNQNGWKNVPLKSPDGPGYEGLFLFCPDLKTNLYVAALQYICQHRFLNALQFLINSHCFSFHWSNQLCYIKFKSAPPLNTPPLPFISTHQFLHVLFFLLKGKELLTTCRLQHAGKVNGGCWSAHDSLHALTCFRIFGRFATSFPKTIPW